MADIYVVSVGARERLLASSEQHEDHYVVRAGLEPGLLRTPAVPAPVESSERAAAYRVRASVAARSGHGRD